VVKNRSLLALNIKAIRAGMEFVGADGGSADVGSAGFSRSLAGRNDRPEQSSDEPHSLK
jgi:hypothetical protein